MELKQIKNTSEDGVDALWQLYVPLKKVQINRIWMKSLLISAVCN